MTLVSDINRLKSSVGSNDHVARHSFRPFAWYRIIFGIMVLVTAQSGWMDWSEA